jgi:hypothetical protein
MTNDRQQYTEKANSLLLHKFTVKFRHATLLGKSNNQLQKVMEQQAPARPPPLPVETAKVLLVPYVM